VHDELVFEVPQGEVDEVKNLVCDTMENVYSLKVPLLVDVGVGKNWRIWISAQTALEKRARPRSPVGLPKEPRYCDLPVLPCD
jgi:hypothetical protein